MRGDGQRHAAVELPHYAPSTWDNPREAVAELLLPAFLPFNLLKSGLNAGITFLLYKPVVSSLRKSGLIDAPSGPAARRPVGLLLLAAVLVATCVLILLARNGLL